MLTTENKVSFLNTLGKRKFIAFLTMVITGQLINALVLYLSKGSVVIFTPNFFITVFAVYMGVKEVSDVMKKRIETQGQPVTGGKDNAI